jgi:RimJ/RimL family protein N-acetyltransferase
MVPTLETERLRLRGWRQSDFEPFAAYYADPDTAAFVGGTCSRNDAWRRMAAYAGHWTLRGYGFWAVEEKSTNQFVGYAGLWFPEGWPEPEVGWGLLKAGQGKGFATEASLRAREYGFSTIGFKTLISFIDLKNTASRAVAERMGAHLEKTATLFGSEAGIFRHPAPGR